ncbi:MAG: DNA photolyase family protein [Xanthobacteraceae bacterium]|nr:DNA photolyase family protein [Xanthobacteraceae bacterium]
MKSPIIVWFRDDLRLSDHAALREAAQRGGPLVCLYVLDERGGGRPHGAASCWWLANSLRALDAGLKKLGQTLVLRKGDAALIIPELAANADTGAVLWLESEVPAQAARDRKVAQALQRAGSEARILRSDLLAKPDNIRNKDGNGLRVFTPFWKRVLSLDDPARPLAAPKTLPPPVRSVASERLEDWKLEPSKPDWATGFREAWSPGENGAQQRLHDFLDGPIKGYATDRDRPDGDHTSGLSPHLRFGEISPRQVFHAAKFAAERQPALARDIDKFLSELGWREFCRHLLFDNPDIDTRNLQSSFDDFPWRRDAKALRAWQRGQTGYPVVDAGMRELWHTGVMHNRVRMVVASFLVKHLLLDWRLGEQWFWDTLVDADPGSNPANWQWVAGSGADAAPYFRVFNPVLQGEKFDPDGAYVSKWVPELAKLSPKFIHHPWDATPIELQSAGIVLGDNYPEPIVDHKAARERALAAYRKTRA